MPDGDKEPSVVEKIFQLYKEGLTLEQIVELVNDMVGSDEALRWDASAVSRLLKRHRSSAGGPSVPEKEDDTSPEAQEAACVEWAESRGYRVDKADVYRDVGSGGGADA